MNRVVQKEEWNKLSEPDISLIGHTDIAEFALTTCSAGPLVASGGRDANVCFLYLNVEHITSTLEFALRMGSNSFGTIDADACAFKKPLDCCNFSSGVNGSADLWWCDDALEGLHRCSYGTSKTLMAAAFWGTRTAPVLRRSLQPPNCR